MPYAADNQISQLPIQGGIQITQQEYEWALEQMLAGRAVAVVDGELKLAPEPEPEAPVEPPEPTLTDLKAAKLNEINAAYSAAVRVLASGYPDEERESWPVQIMEARALIDDSSADTPWIDSAANDRGITREVLADLIIAQDSAYRVIHGGLSGTRQRLRDAIENAQTPADLDAITWEQS